MLKHKVQDRQCDEALKSADLVKCRVKIYKINMQRCPYIHEMKERLLGEQVPVEQIQPAKKPMTPPPIKMEQQTLLPQQQQQQPVATVVKLNPDGYGSHTSPTHVRADRAPLMPKQPEDDFQVYETKTYPKNAKTSLFIIMSFVYAKLLVVVCIAYVISDVVTHNIPLFYYEGFFTYLYGMSILFLLYVFCFLLQESSCCSGNEKEKKVKTPPKQKSKEKDKERKKEEEKKKKEEREQKKREEKEKKKEKDKEKDKKSKNQEKQKASSSGSKADADFNISFSFEDIKSTTYRRNSEGVVDAEDVVPVPVAELSENAPPVHRHSSQGPPQPDAQGAGAPPPPLPPPTAPAAAAHANNVDVESGAVVPVQLPQRSRCKRKTTQNDQSHGSFFLRIGAIAFGLGTMIYNGLEFGAFFEIPFNSPCYMILRGVNPVLQMIFTFMQMYFIFMNSRLNIHRFKVVARFGLMHVAATNLCVWIRTLVLEYIKEITIYHRELFNMTGPTDSSPLADSIRQHTLRNANAILGVHRARPDAVPNSTTTTVATLLAKTIAEAPSNLNNFVQSTARSASPYLNDLLTTTASTFVPPTTTTTTRIAAEPDLAEDFSNGISSNSSELLDDITPQALINYFNQNVTVSNDSCGRINIMGNIVQDSAPYLFPFIIEYSLIGAAVIYVMWKHIGRNPRYVTQEDLEHRLEIMLSRRAVAMAQAQQGRVDCVGASKGLFFGLLMLVGSLICLILFFVLIHHKDLGMLAIWLADVSHCVLMVLSIIAIIIGFIRVQNLKFKTEEQSDLNDILLRVSAFGLFTYAVFSVIAGHLSIITGDIPNLLVMVTGVVAVVQVILQFLFIADVSRRRVHLPEHDRTKPGRQVVTFLLICNLTMWIIYTFEAQKVEANPVQKQFYGFLSWAIIQRITLPLCIFHRFHSAVTLAEIWKTSYKARLE
ncbi:proton channel otopetrin-like a isoform X14 [Rhynchophorus ferrugineus]|uniref:proton channel otopetrin-like a isoform X14 n=1 Tax=Rhynchophorus ferrugineus TaxID=354439 RepID=UPI003FCEE4BA